MIITPKNNAITNDNTPLFSWIHNDTDSVSQIGYQWQMDDNMDFKSIDYESRITTSSQNTFIPTTQIPDGIWYWRLRTCDSDGGWGKYCNSMKILIDTKPPESMIINVQNNSFYKQMNNIEGTGLDPDICSGINRTELFIKRLSDNKYWTGLEWVFDQLWLSTTGFEHWKYKSNLVNWTSKESYLIQSRAFDNATNQEIPGTGIVFNYDTDPPISLVEIPVIYDINQPYSAILYPGENTYLNHVETIFGNATDTGGSGIANVEISIKDRSSSRYWNGNLWQEKGILLTTNGTDNWTYNTSSISWTSDVYYQIHSKATDKAGNYMVSEPGNTFMYDSKPPEVSFLINDDARYTNSTSITLTLDVSDTGSGVSQMSFSLDGVQWSMWRQYSNDRVLDISTGDGEKTVYLRISDKANNTCSPVAERIILDTEPPECSVLINDNATYTNSKEITLRTTGSDLLSGVSDMSFSTDSYIWSPWEKSSLTRNFELSGNDGVKSVYLRVRDHAGNIAICCDTIILDSTPPHSLTISANNGAPETKSTEITLTLSAMDDLSGVGQMMIRTHLNTSETWEEFNEKMSYDLPTENGPIVIYFSVKDKAGNIAQPVTTAIVLHTTIQNEDIDKLDKEPQSSFFIFYILILVLIIVIILTLVAIISKRRKKTKLGDPHPKEQEQVKGELVDITLKSPELPVPMSVAVAQVSPPQTVLQLPPVAVVVSTSDGKQPHDILPSTAEPRPQLPPAQPFVQNIPTPIISSQPNQTAIATTPGIK